jgi:hypothetical protein
MAVLPLPSPQWLGPFPFMAAMNKFLAQINKSRAGNEATKPYHYQFVPAWVSTSR